MIAAHKMSFIEYKSQFLQFRERRKRSASGLESGDNNESSGHHRRNSGGPSKTRWCAQWYNGASYACTVCPFRTHVRTRMTKHVRAEHPERLSTKRTGATDGVFETTFGRFRCEFCGEEICHNKTEIVRHLECHAMDLDTYRRLYLPSSSVVVTAAGGSGEAVIVARRKPPPSSSTSQKSTTAAAAAVAYESTTTTSSSTSDQRNRRSDDEGGGSGELERHTGGGHPAVLSHHHHLERESNSPLLSGGWHMEGRGSGLSSGGDGAALDHQRPLAGYAVEPPLGGWKIERPPSADGETDQQQQQLEDVGNSDERPHHQHQLPWKLEHQLPPHSIQLLSSSLSMVESNAASTDVVSGHPPPSHLMMPDEGSSGHHHHHHLHHHLGDIDHHHPHLQHLQHIVSSNNSLHHEQLGLHGSVGGGGGGLHSRESEGFGGGEEEEEGGEGAGGRCLSGEMERFRCPIPDCNFWTDMNVSFTFRERAWPCTGC